MKLIGFLGVLLLAGWVGVWIYLGVPPWYDGGSIVCQYHEDLTLRDLTIDVPEGTALVIEPHCKLTLIDTVVRAPVAIQTAEHAKVKLTDSTVEADQTAIRLGLHADLSLNGGLVSAPTAVHASGYNELNLAAGAVKGTLAAISCSTQSCELHRGMATITGPLRNIDEP